MRYMLGLLLVMAVGVNAAEDKHTLGFMLGTSQLDLADDREKDQNDPMSAFFYDYRLHPHYAINVSYLDAEGEYCVVVCTSENRYAQLKSWQASVKGFLPVNSRLELFGRAGVTRYRFEITGNAGYSDYQLPDRDDSGTGAVLAVGLQAQRGWFRIGTELQHQFMGSDSATSLAVLLGVAF